MGHQKSGLRVHPDTVDFRHADCVRAARIRILDIEREAGGSFTAEVNGAQCQPGGRRWRASEGIGAIGECAGPGCVDAAARES